MVDLGKKATMWNLIKGFFKVHNHHIGLFVDTSAAEVKSCLKRTSRVVSREHFFCVCVCFNVNNPLLATSQGTDKYIVCTPHKALACSGLCCRDCDMVSVVINCACSHLCVKSFLVLWCQMSWSWDQDAHKLSGCTGVQTIDVILYLNHALCTGLNDVNV